MKTKTNPLYLSSLLFLIGLFYVWTRRFGHSWGDDFAMYIAHARNIVLGRPYADVGLIFDSHNPGGPPAYPPVFPLLLAPVYAVWGLNLEVMKIETIGTFLVALFAIYHACPRLDKALGLLLVAAIGLHPFLWLLKDNVLSDIPFLMFVNIALACFEKAQEDSRYFLGSWFSTVLAVGTRLLGLALPVAWIAWYAARRKKPDIWLWMTLLFSGITALFSASPFKHAWTTGVALTPALFFANLQRYVFEMQSLWQNAFSPALGWVLFIGLVLLAGWGFGKKRLDQWALMDFFAVLYAGELLFSVFYEYSRYLLPLLPIFLCYSFLGLSKIPSRWRSATTTACALTLAVSYLSLYRQLSFGPLREGILRPESQDLFQYVQTQTQATDILVFQKPRALALYTDRKTSFFSLGSDAEIWARVAQIQATYLITDRSAEDRYNRLAMEAPKRCQLIYHNDRFNVWKVIRA